MSESRELRCRRISEITKDMTEKAIALYDEDKLDRFWSAIEALHLLLEVEVGVCEIVS